MNVCFKHELIEDISCFIINGMQSNDIAVWCQNAIPNLSFVYEKYIDNTVDCYIHASDLMYFIHNVYTGSIDSCLIIARQFVEAQISHEISKMRIDNTTMDLTLTYA